MGGNTLDMTKGSAWKLIVQFAVPVFLSQVFQQLYNTVDAVIVGRFVGKEALSCVSGSSGQIINLVVGFFTGLSAGATVMISQHFGAKNEEQLHKALHTAYAFAITGGIIAGVIGVVMTRMVLKWMNTPENLLPDSTLYVRIYFAGLLFIFVYNMGAAILRAIGDSKRPLLYLIICCMTNIVLDFLFVVGMQMGVMGAALATILSQIILSLIHI